LLPVLATNRQQREFDSLSRSTLLPIRSTLLPVCSLLGQSDMVDFGAFQQSRVDGVQLNFVAIVYDDKYNTSTSEMPSPNTERRTNDSARVFCPLTTALRN